MQTSITISGIGRLFGGDLDAVLEACRAAEAAGVDSVVVADHVAIGPETRRYPYGRFPYGPEEPWPEPLTLLAAAAAVTDSIRLGTGILIAPLRPPLLLAKTVATLDALSGGRLDLGLGTGWQPEEYAGRGVDFDARGHVLDDTVAACRALWGGAPASFTSASVTFDDLWCVPAPIQAGGPPLWFGGPPTGPNLRRIVDNEAGWLPVAGTSLDEVAAGVRALADATGGHTVPVRASPPEPDPATLAAWAAAGVTVASFALPRYVDTPSGIAPFCSRLVSAAAAVS